jgi:hypothetical protein
MVCSYLDNYFNGTGNDPSAFDIPDAAMESVAVFPTFVLTPDSAQPIRLRVKTPVPACQPLQRHHQYDVREFVDPMGYDDNEISPEDLAAAIKLLSLSKFPGRQTPQTLPRNMMMMDATDAHGKLGRPTMSLVDQIVHRFVKHLLSKGIKIVAWDFDETIAPAEFTVEYFNTQNICQRISPLFVKIATALLENNIGVAMVTYNSNPLIGPAVSSLLDTNIPVFFRADHEIGTGKGWHLTNVIRFYNDLLGIGGTPRMITSKNVMLIDDQPDNIDIALSNGYSCIHNKTVVTLDDFINFIEKGE